MSPWSDGRRERRSSRWNPLHLQGLAEQRAQPWVGMAKCGHLPWRGLATPRTPRPRWRWPPLAWALQHCLDWSCLEVQLEWTHLPEQKAGLTSLSLRATDLMTFRLSAPSKMVSTAPAACPHGLSHCPLLPGSSAQPGPPPTLPLASWL